MAATRLIVLAGSLLVFGSHPASAAPPTREEAAAALNRAVAFFRSEVSVEGTYVWRYSDDLALCEGEGKATRTTAWVQSPGTPAVGEALLAAYERTKEPHLLDAAVAAAHGLVKGQLASGGWDYRIEFEPEARKRYAYRVDGSPDSKPRNVTTLDDDNTQSALRFLMHVDRTLAGQDAKIREAVKFALESLAAAQYPNGAWPQRFSGPPKAENHPVRKAAYPDSFLREWPNVNYTGYYTLNDNSLATTISTLFEAAEIYGERRYADAARRGGDFLNLAQMPDPQPAWAQQYDAQMHPSWARKFEPPSVTGGESQGAIRILMDVYRQTGDAKYLEPIPRALDYLEKSTLPGGRLARFYELKTNRPLYFTKQYELVYTDDDLPTHYAFVVTSSVARLRRDFEKLRATDPEKLKPAPKPPTYELSDDLAAAVRRAIDALDSRGAWVEEGRLREADPDRRVTRIITAQTFIRNLDTLSRFLAAAK
jgi:PelA/Pel-15E family pectate lyase